MQNQITIRDYHAAKKQILADPFNTTAFTYSNDSSVLTYGKRTSVFSIVDIALPQRNYFSQLVSGNGGEESLEIFMHSSGTVLLALHTQNFTVHARYTKTSVSEPFRFLLRLYDTECHHVSLYFFDTAHLLPVLALREPYFDDGAPTNDTLFKLLETHFFGKEGEIRDF